jgi:hypothetical protein
MTLPVRSPKARGFLITGGITKITHLRYLEEAELAEFLEKSSGFACQNVEITNKERQIAFVVGENRYELTLVQKRPSKT